MADLAFDDIHGYINTFQIKMKINEHIPYGSHSSGPLSTTTS